MVSVLYNSHIIMLLLLIPLLLFLDIRSLILGKSEVGENWSDD